MLLCITFKSVFQSNRGASTGGNTAPSGSLNRGGAGAGAGSARGHRGGQGVASGGTGGLRCKPGEPDLEEKFGRFEIKPPPVLRGATALGRSGGGGGGTGAASLSSALSEQGDETVSMVSDTWSTDVLASDTEGPVGGEGSGDALLIQLRAQRSGDLGKTLFVISTLPSSWKILTSLFTLNQAKISLTQNFRQSFTV